LAVIVLALSMIDFRASGQHQYADIELAKGCAVSPTEFQLAKARVKLRPVGVSTKAGRCTLSIDKSGRILLAAAEAMQAGLK
jgi:hypothetical protein